MSRVASAVVLVLILASTLWLLPAWATAVLTAVAAALAAAEVAHMVGAAGAPVPAVFVATAAALLTQAVLLSAHTGEAMTGLTTTVMVTLVVAAGVVTLALSTPGPATITRASAMTFIPVYVGLPLGAIAWIHTTHGPAATTWLVGLVAASDSAQYYAGRAFGRRKLAPAVSPAKTVEGAVGGLVVAVLFGFFLGPMCLPGVPAAASALLAFVLALFGMAGDLFESLLKRSAGVKDSSHLIPGHGGVLDRIDSHLFAAPVFYLFLRYLA
jgi:phosphatidate cytidylyltransferase